MRPLRAARPPWTNNYLFVDLVNDVNQYPTPTFPPSSAFVYLPLYLAPVLFATLIPPLLSPHPSITSNHKNILKLTKETEGSPPVGRTYPKKTRRTNYLT